MKVMATAAQAHFILFINNINKDIFQDLQTIPNFN